MPAVRKTKEKPAQPALGEFSKATWHQPLELLGTQWRKKMLILRNDVQMHVYVRESRHWFFPAKFFNSLSSQSLTTVSLSVGQSTLFGKNKYVWIN